MTSTLLITGSSSGIVLVNNAGFGTDGVFEAMDDEVIARQFDTNVFGLMRVTRAIIPHFRSNQKGIIIQIASMGGRLAFPLFSIYHSSKWAVEGFSESLPYELAPFGTPLLLLLRKLLPEAWFLAIVKNSYKN